jgi:hypothetical protein
MYTHVSKYKNDKIIKSYVFYYYIYATYFNDNTEEIKNRSVVARS